MGKKSENQNSSSFAGIDVETVKLRAKEVASSAAETALDIKDKSAAEELLDAAKEKANDIGNEIDYATKVLFSSLYETWTNSSETFTLIIGKDGTVKISDATGTFGADAFTYTEVDDDTVRLKVASDNFFASVLSIDMDYYVNGEILTVSAMGQSVELTRKK